MKKKQEKKKTPHTADIYKAFDAMHKADGTTSGKRYHVSSDSVSYSKSKD